jgi:hypothetical protein
MYGKSRIATLSLFCSNFGDSTEGAESNFAYAAVIMVISRQVVNERKSLEHQARTGCIFPPERGTSALCGHERTGRFNRLEQDGARDGICTPNI